MLGQKGRLVTINGSVLNPQNGGLHLILNFANTAGKGEGPMYPLFDKKWKKVKEEVRMWFINKTGAYKLGAVNTTTVQSDSWICNMLVQDDDLKVDLKSLETSMKHVLKIAKDEKASIHIGEELVTFCPEVLDFCKVFLENGVNVYFYKVKTKD